jgi:hypothetical protein
MSLHGRFRRQFSRDGRSSCSSADRAGAVGRRRRSPVNPRSDIESAVPEFVRLDGPCRAAEAPRGPRTRYVLEAISAAASIAPRRRAARAIGRRADAVSSRVRAGRIVYMRVHERVGRAK